MTLIESPNSPATYSQVVIRLPADERAALDALAERLDRSRAWVVRKALRDLLEREAKEARR